jgi:hypothetical protein
MKRIEECRRNILFHLFINLFFNVLRLLGDTVKLKAKTEARQTRECHGLWISRALVWSCSVIVTPADEIGLLPTTKH